jgi:hypothetical protein
LTGRKGRQDGELAELDPLEFRLRAEAGIIQVGVEQNRSRIDPQMAVPLDAHLSGVLTRDIWQWVAFHRHREGPAHRPDSPS